MTISGVALLSICTLLGVALGVKANVGGVGIAMMFLIAARLWLAQRGLLSHGLLGQLLHSDRGRHGRTAERRAAVKGGPIVILAEIAEVAVCLATVALIGRLSGPIETMDEIEAREACAMAGQPLALKAGRG